MNYANFLLQLRYYLGTHDTTVVTDAILDGFLRQGEEMLNARMRVNDMVQVDTAPITQGRVELPPDWIENDFIRIVDGRELKFKGRGQFYNMTDNDGWYTTSGLFLIVGGDPSPTNSKDVELHYFGDVPPLTGDANWVSTRYFSLLLSASLYYATGGTQDDERSMKYEAYVDKQCKILADNRRASIGKGSRLNIRAKGLG